MHNPALRRFVAIYVPAVVLLAALTMTTVNPFVLPVWRLRLTGMLPLAGFMVLLLGALLGGLIIYMIDEKEFGKRFAIVGIVITLVASIAVSNCLRKPIIASIGARQGRSEAARVVRQEDSYQPVAFTVREHAGHIGYFFFRSGDEDTFRSAFYRAYNHAFQNRHADLVDKQALRNLGYRDGFQHGRGAGRNAYMQGRTPDDVQMDQRVLSQLHQTHLPSYVEGYRQGYAAGWTTGYHEAPR